MKHTHKMALALMSLLAMGQSVYGYLYDFTNTMRGPVMVRVKFSVSQKHYYAKLEGKNQRLGRNYIFDMKPGAFHALTAEAAEVKKPVGKSIDAAINAGKFAYVGSKAGFCLSQIAVAPYEWDEKRKRWERTDEYYDLAPFFVETNYFTKMSQAAGAVGDGAFQTAASILKMIAAGL